MTAQLRLTMWFEVESWDCLRTQQKRLFLPPQNPLKAPRLESLAVAQEITPAYISLHAWESQSHV